MVFFCGSERNGLKMGLQTEDTDTRYLKVIRKSAARTAVSLGEEFFAVFSRIDRQCAEDTKG